MIELPRPWDRERPVRHLCYRQRIPISWHLIVVRPWMIRFLWSTPPVVLPQRQSGPGYRTVIAHAGQRGHVDLQSQARKETHRQIRMPGPSRFRNSDRILPCESIVSIPEGRLNPVHVVPFLVPNGVVFRITPCVRMPPDLVSTCPPLVPKISESRPIEHSRDKPPAKPPESASPDRHQQRRQWATRPFRSREERRTAHISFFAGVGPAKPVGAELNRHQPYRTLWVSDAVPWSAQDASRYELALRDSHADSYDVEYATLHGPWFARLETAVLLDNLDLRPSHVLVDVGCGTGRITTLLATRCARVIAVDRSQRSLEILESRIEERGLRNVRSEERRV